MNKPPVGLAARDAARGDEAAGKNLFSSMGSIHYAEAVIELQLISGNALARVKPTVGDQLAALIQVLGAE